MTVPISASATTAPASNSGRDIVDERGATVSGIGKVPASPYICRNRTSDNRRRAWRKRPGRPAYSQPCLLAGVIERRKLVAAHLDEFWRQAAVMADPGADLRRVEPHHQRAALAGRHQFARRVIVIGGRMEPEHRALGNADMVARHDPGQQGARRQAWPVDDDMLAGRARRLELVNVGSNLAAW